LAKLCVVGIVCFIFLLAEMKCHESWRNVFLSSTMINKIKIHFILAGLASNSCKASSNLKTLATINWLHALKYHSSLTVKFSVNCVIYPTTVTRQTGEYKVDLTRHPKFGERLFSTLLLKNCWK
jgi:hypothetical protein